MKWHKIEKPFSRDSHSVSPDSRLANPCPSGWIMSIQIVNDNRCCTHVSGWFEPKNSGPKRGIWHRPPKSKKNNANTKGSTRRARNTQARDLASPPKKAKKRTQTRKAGADEEETPKRGIWHRPQKRQKKNPNTKGYAKPFCSDGGSVILSTLITAPQTGLHPPCLLVCLIPFPFPLLAAGGTTFPCQAKGSTGYGETENQWKSRKSKGKDTNGYDKSFD